MYILVSFNTYYVFNFVNLYIGNINKPNLDDVLFLHHPTYFVNMKQSN